MQLANRPLLAPCYKLSLVSTVVHGRFKGSDSGRRLRCRFRGVVDAVAVNPVKYRLAYKVVDVAGTSEPMLHWIDVHLRAEVSQARALLSSGSCPIKGPTDVSHIF
jgi:hypothetical protein